MDFDKKEANLFFIALLFLFLIKLEENIASPISGKDGDLGMGLSLIRQSLVWTQEKFFVHRNREAESSY